ncbi:MAG: metallophosphoesterase [Trueperaceae bacterium]|nr:metallophosphoesterase [Trueperaceae bacterium]
MRVFAIADPHLSSARPKPMTVFGPGWAGHPEAFFAGWRRVVAEDDLVLVPGDVSWAMRLDEAHGDLHAIADLPGTKVLLRGNHDYWWPSIGRLRAALPERMLAVQNDAVRVGDVVVGGTRGWSCPGTHGFGEHDQKVYEREVARLRLSLEAMRRLGDGFRVVMLHFPPTNVRGEPSGFTDALRDARPDALVFGHVHGDGPVALPELPGTAVHFVAADRVGFEPVLVRAAAGAAGEATGAPW